MLQLKIVVILITLILNHAFAVEGDIISGEESTCAKKATEYTSGLNQMMEVSKGINSANNRSVGYNLCMAYRIAGPDRNEKLKEAINKELGKSPTTNISDKEVSDFLNKHNDNLICNAKKNNNLYENEHFYKRSMSNSDFTLFYDLLMNDDMDIDFNMVEIRNGKKETLIDYIDDLLKSTVGPQTKEEIRNLRAELREDFGAKYYREL